MKPIQNQNIKSVVMAAMLALAAVAIFGSAFWAILPAKRQVESLYNNLDKAYDRHAVVSYHFTPTATDLMLRPDSDAHFAVPFARKLQKTHKIEITFDHLVNSGSITFYLADRHAEFAESRKERNYVKTGMTTYEFRVPAGEYSAMRFDFDGRATQGSARITDLKLSRVLVKDYQPYLYLVALALISALILPGAIIHVLLFEGDRLRKAFLYAFPAFSIIFYVTVYLGFELARAWGADTGVAVRFLAAALLAILVLLVWQRKRMPALQNVFKAHAVPLITYVILTMLACGIVSFGKLHPFNNLHHGLISGSKTFMAFNAHDNYFQYVNGIAIADDEPFSKYYAKGALIYKVQDRQMLPGVIYAMFIKLAGGCGEALAKSYLTYTMLGICLNALIVFPLISLFRRYFPSVNLVWFLVVFSINAFVLINLYITWFKFSGAAFFLCGAAALADDHKHLPSWLLAGTCWGIGANMHAGNVLGIPFLFLWFWIHTLRVQGLKSIKAYLSPLLLILVFVLLNLPWTLVKKVHFKDNYSLFKTHYFAGINHGKEMTRSFRHFMRDYPLETQISFRARNLRRSLRWAEIKELGITAVNGKFAQLAIQWSRLEWNYLAIAVYPPALFLVLYWGWQGIGRGQKPTFRRRIFNVLKQDRWQLLLILAASFVILIFAGFGRHAPDITYHLPMGLILMLQMLLIGWVLECGIAGKVFSIFFAAAGIIRMGYAYIHYNPQWIS